MADSFSDFSGPTRPARPAPELIAISKSRFHPMEFATYVFLTSLAVFFISSIIAYMIIRLSGARMSAMVPMSLPSSVWVSTAALLATSVALTRAVQQVRRERQRGLRRSLVLASLFGMMFLVVQGWSLFEILDQHYVALEQRMSLYGVVFFLVGLHAVHVLGGLFCLAVVTIRAHQDRYDHECYRGLRICAVYWHFLDAVWLVMLVALLATS